MQSSRGRLLRSGAPGLVILLALTLAGLLTLSALFADEPQYDVLITNGHIVDGTGSPWYEGSVAIRDGKIAAIGRLGEAPARRVIDAAGLVVAPGFIDLHSHSDYTLLYDGNAQSKIRQGVTTEILGESESAAPAIGQAAEAVDRELRPMGLKRDWTTFREYFARFERQGASVNIASYVGSGQLRLAVMGNVDRAPTPEETDKMKALVEQAMRDGAIGIASGLIYPPNSFAKTDELIELAKVAARYGGIYTTHMRNEGSQIARAIDEAIAIGEQSGLPVHILHLKLAGVANWGHMQAVLDRIQAARDRGLDITADQYPYIAGMTDLHMCLPSKYLEGTNEQIVARLKDANVRGAIRKDLQAGVAGWEDLRAESGGWNGVLVASLQQTENKKFEGKRMDEIASMMGKDPLDALCDLLISEGGSAMAIYFVMSEADVRLAMKQPWVGIGSDGVAVSPEMIFAGKPHPRFYGTFPRVLGRYVREEKVLTLPDAVRKMTSLPAQITGLTDRGVLRPGMAADVVMFDAKRVNDTAKFEDPSHYPAGIPYVVVNGVVVIDRGRHTGAHPGRVLYGRGRIQ